MRRCLSLARDMRGLYMTAKTENYYYQNQDTPLCRGFIPILNIDVWEHAYYLKHYNDRKAYIEDFVKAVNWAMAEKRLCNQKSF